MKQDAPSGPVIVERSAQVPEYCSEIWLAGGCFWGTEEYLSELQGVIATDVGYANGNTEKPTYETVCSHTTGYAEVVRVVYDSTKLSLPFLLEMYFQSIDPTSVNRQGGDRGDQYRTGIYYLDPKQLPVIQQALQTLQQQVDKPVAVEVKPLHNYYLAEAYHQQYLKKNPGGYCHIPRSMMSYARTAKEYRKPQEAELRKRLSPLQYEVTQKNATEPPHQNEYNRHFERGIYVDAVTGQPLFLSTHKYESGCGWPAFSRPIRKEDVLEVTDTSHGMLRTEVRSRSGDCHLGHVFEDGPTESGGLRYCINSAALRFVSEAQMEQEGYGYLLEFLSLDEN